MHCRDCRWWEPIEADPGEGICHSMSTAFIGGIYRLYPRSSHAEPVATPELFVCSEWQARAVTTPDPSGGGEMAGGQ